MVEPRDFCIVWEFDVVPEKIQDFREAYGPGGPWGRLFGRSDGYRRTELLQDPTQQSRFLTMDIWRSREDFNAFKDAFGGDYAELDARFEAWTRRETKIGVFDLSRAVPA